MRRRIFLWGCICLLLGVLLAGCGKQEKREKAEDSVIEKTEEKKVLIGMSFDSFVIERWIRDRDVFVSKAKELGADVNVQNANGDVQEQISQIQYLMDKKVDVLCVVAADCGEMSEVIQEAKSRGIKTISYDRLILNADTDLYVSFDNEMVGTIMARAIKSELPEGGKIFLIQGAKEDNNVSQVRQGIDNELSGSNLEIVYETHCDGWIAENAIAQVQEALSEHPDVAGIICGNDDIATQVIRVLAQERLAGKVKVVGQDGDLAACQRIVEGTQAMTAFKSVVSLAEEAAECAVRMGRGELDVEELGTLSDGAFEVPSLLLLPVAVTRENLESVIIDGGFHSREDVFLNVAQ